MLSTDNFRTMPRLSGTLPLAVFIDRLPCLDPEAEERGEVAAESAFASQFFFVVESLEPSDSRRLELPVAGNGKAYMGWGGCTCL